MFNLTQLPNTPHPTSRIESSNNNFQRREENLTIELRGWEDFYLPEETCFIIFWQKLIQFIGKHRHEWSDEVSAEVREWIDLVGERDTARRFW